MCCGPRVSTSELLLVSTYMQILCRLILLIVECWGLLTFTDSNLILGYASASSWVLHRARHYRTASSIVWCLLAKGRGSSAVSTIRWQISVYHPRQTSKPIRSSATSCCTHCRNRIKASPPSRILCWNILRSYPTRGHSFISYNSEPNFAIFQIRFTAFSSSTSASTSSKMVTQTNSCPVNNHEMAEIVACRTATLPNTNPSVKYAPVGLPNEAEEQRIDMVIDVWGQMPHLRCQWARGLGDSWKKLRLLRYRLLKMYV